MVLISGHVAWTAFSCCYDLCNMMSFPNWIMIKFLKDWDCVILVKNRRGVFLKVSQYRKEWVDKRRFAIHWGCTLYLPERSRLCRQHPTCPSRLTWGALWRRLRCEFILPNEFRSSCLWNPLEESCRETCMVYFGQLHFFSYPWHTYVLCIRAICPRRYLFR